MRALAVIALIAAAGAAVAAPAPFTTSEERCIVPAATYHRVNPHVLRAILRVESGLKPGAVNRNPNGTVDVGMGQMNSIHFRRLSQYGITPQDLLDECVATYVAGWHLSSVMREHGNTWQAIARYHSATPYFNYRYQVLLRNELVRAGVLEGQVLPVPSMTKGAAPARAQSPSAHEPVRRSAPQSAKSLVYDWVPSSSSN